MGFIYLLREREFIKTNEKIYKIGRTNQKMVLTRINSYPKQSEMLYISVVYNCVTMENKLKSIFRNRFVIHDEVGSEYFEGNLDEMLTIIKFEVHEELNLYKKVIINEPIRDLEIKKRNYIKYDKIVDGNPLNIPVDYNHFKSYIDDCNIDYYPNNKIDIYRDVTLIKFLLNYLLTYHFEFLKYVTFYGKKMYIKYYDQATNVKDKRYIFLLYIINNMIINCRDEIKLLTLEPIEEALADKCLIIT